MALACTAASSRLIHHPYCRTVLPSNKNHPRTPPPFISIHSRPVGAAQLTTTTPSSSSSSSALHSVDVSKDDKPLETTPQQSTQQADAAADEQEEEEQPKLDPRRFEEKFAVLNTGIHECRSCGYRYDQAAGDPSYPVPPGLPFARLPDDWRCPTCGAAQSFFESKSVEIAGFAQNQQFGLGGNSLTSGQKGLLIYGGLLVGFLFFISGYFLQ